MSNHAVSPHILVGTDGSSSALRAVCWAAAEAQRRRVKLLIAHIVDAGLFAYDPLVALQYGGDDDTAAAEVIATAEQRVEKHFPNVVTARVITAGDPAAQLISLSRAAILTVVGASGHGGFSATLLGSVAMALITHGDAPVAVVRPGADGRVPRVGAVVVGVDGSECSVDAVAWAFDEASRRRAPLVAVHSWTFYASSLAPLPASLESQRDLAAQVVAERAVIAERLAGWQEKYPDVEVRRITKIGHPADELIDVARDAQLIVVGSRGHGERTGAWFDSVTRTLIHHAQCPVLVARHRHTA